MSEDWYEYITTEPGFHYLKVDALMTYYYRGTQMGDLKVYPNGKYYVDGKLYGVPDEINGQYGQTPYFKTYNESRAYTDKNGKEHTSYDISASGGIPTKEKLVNGVEVDGFYGYVDIGKHTVTNTAWDPDGEEEFNVPWRQTLRGRGEGHAQHMEAGQ